MSAEIPAATSSVADEEETTPEVLRGTRGEARLKSLDISLEASPPPMPYQPPSSPAADPPPMTKTCSCTDPDDCTVECEEDEDGGYCLSTQKPEWWWVFPS